MKIRKNLLIFSVVVGLTPAWSCLADGKDAPKLVTPALPSDSRIKVLSYDESDVYVIRTKYGYQTNIVFDPLEEIQTISVGDRSLWQIIPAGNRLYIRPLTEDISTNMTLLTNKRSYEFDIKSVDAKDDSNIYVARFMYPDKKPQASFAQTATVVPATVVQPAIVKPAATSNAPALPVHPNYSYTYSGADALAPARIYDDGKSTFISYQSLGKQFQLPSVFIVGANGKETPAITSVHGSDITVSAVAGEMVLRSNAGEVRVYNEALNPKIAPAAQTEGGANGR